ncbi:MAG: translation elongation factor Ts [Candidatus Puniceispirillales bacterium]
MSITAQMVKELRLKSSAGMMDCKKALIEMKGDMDAAVDWLRKKGLATASKKSGRVASEGLIGISLEGNQGAIVEVNSETDFVARNQEFQEFVISITDVAIKNNGNLDEILKSNFPNSEKNIKDILTDKIAKIGENMSIRRSEIVSVSNGTIIGYMHNAVNDRLGKIGVLVALESNADKTSLQKLGKELAMHIAATSPSSISIEDLSSELVERERKVLIDQAIASGKPEDIAKKIVEGRLRKFYSEVVLLEQTFVIDGETKVSDVIKKVSKDLNQDIKINSFIRYNLGEGIEKSTKNFADEVAEQLSD